MTDNVPAPQDALLKLMFHHVLVGDWDGAKAMIEDVTSVDVLVSLDLMLANDPRTAAMDRSELTAAMERQCDVLRRIH